MTRKLVRTILVPLVVALLVLVLPLAVIGYRTARDQLVELAEQRATTVALTAAAVDSLVLATRVDALVDAVPRLEGERILILDAGNRAVADSGGAPVRVPATLLSAARQGGISSQLDDEQDLVVAAAPVAREGRVIGSVVVALPTELVMARSRFFLTVLGLAAVGLVLAALLAGRSLARSVVRPVEALDRAAARLAEGDLAARVDGHQGPPELQRLGATFNATAARLEQLIETQRTFVADASHQLRTPLTALKLRLENLQTTGASPERLTAVTNEVDRIARTVDQLLALARAEREQTTPVTTDLEAAIRTRLAAWGPGAQEAGVRLVPSVPPGLPRVRSVPGAVEQTLDNLLSNALRVAPPGSTVDVAARHEGAVVRGSVADRGPGLAEEGRARAFDRFWRSPTAHKDGGSGLGLPIVARLIEASGGTVALEPREGGGLVAAFTLPVDDPTA